MACWPIAEETGSVGCASGRVGGCVASRRRALLQALCAGWGGTGVGQGASGGLRAWGIGTGDRLLRHASRYGDVGAQRVADYWPRQDHREDRGSTQAGERHRVHACATGYTRSDARSRGFSEITGEEVKTTVCPRLCRGPLRAARTCPPPPDVEVGGFLPRRQAPAHDDARAQLRWCVC